MTRDYPQIITNRLLLRLPQVNEAAEISNFLQQENSHLAGWETFKGDDYLTENHWQLRIAIYREQFLHDISCCLILRDRETDVFMGMVDYTHIIRNCFESCFLGFKIGEAFQGKGYMTEAISASLSYVFNTLNLHRVAACYMPRNIASGRVLEKCKFQKEGFAPAYIDVNGVWEDHVLTSIINPRWKA